MTGERLSRRQILRTGTKAAGGLVGLGAAGLVGFELPHSSARAAAAGHSASAAAAQGGYNPDSVVRHFVSRPDLAPPAVTVTSVGTAPPATSPAYIFLAAKGYPGSANGQGQAGNIIMDRRGHMVWFHPGPDIFDLNTQTYQGKPVLTWWQGKVTAGHGEGVGVIADASYGTIETVRAGNGLMVDLHEFVITPQDTALITAYRTARADLTKFGGKADGYVLEGIVQEIDIATGKLLFQWQSLDHVDVAETMAPFADGSQKSPFDYFHINSIAVAPDGDLIVSGRNTCAAYKVSRSDGRIAWRLGGRRSSFKMRPGSRFYFQHHIRPHGSSLLSVFDDGGAPPRIEMQSRAILLDLDTSAMTATLRKAYLHPAGVAAANQGSTQLLPDGRVFVGWGDEPYFSEFAPGGALQLDGEFPVGDQSYRAFTADWVGHPAQKPDIVAQVNPAGGTVVYASWNGATEVTGWRVRAGKTAASLAAVGSQEWLGFETPIAVGNAGPYFAVTPYDRSGNALATSETVKVRNA